MRGFRGAVAAWMVMGGSLLSGAANAQLFPDNEARRAIVELREKADADKKSHADAQTRLGEQLQQLQRSVLELSNQVEQMRAELAKQRGANEQLTREVSELQRKQRDMQQAMAVASEERAKVPAKPEPQRIVLDGREFAVEPDEKRQYDDAMGLLRQGDYTQANTALIAFQRRWPSSGYTDSARFWHGNALYGKRDHKESIAVFKTFISTAPDHPRVPEAMLASANAHLELKDPKAARASLLELIKLHPKSEAAVAAKERLATLK